MQRTHIDEMLARQVAGDTLADIRTVRRVLRGEQVRGVVADRIAAAIAARRPTVGYASPGLEKAGAP